MEILHLDLKPSQGDKVEFWYFWDNPIISDPLPLSRTTISDLIRDIEGSYYEELTWTRSIPNPKEIGQKLYNWLDSGARLLASKIEGKRSIILAISATERLAHLPWELLHNGTKFLVKLSIIPIRWVKETANKISIENKPQKRALNLLFMATEPKNSGRKPLDYEAEEARILEADKKFDLDLFLQVEESGCLDTLKYLLNHYGKGYFDVFHLTGHADIEGDTPYFVTGTEIGEEHKAYVEHITDVFDDNFPKLMFLSGCHSAQAARQGATPSLAEALIKNGTKAVLGWGHQVLDTGATEAAAILYKELNRGQTLAQSLAITYKELLKRKSKDWHLLRLYVRDTLPSALVTAPREWEETFISQSQIPRLWGTNKVADRMSFVGRRRQIQYCIKKLIYTNSAENVGVVIYGFGGYGKSSLAARLCDRLTDFITIMWEENLNQENFLSKLAKEIRSDDSDLADSISSNPEALDSNPHELASRLERVFRLLPNKKFLFIFDNFENNLELRNQNTVFKIDAVDAVKVLRSLIEAIRKKSSKHRIIITSRYDLPSFSNGMYLERQELNELRGADLIKKINRLGAFKGDSRVDSNLQERAKKLADGNARLLEWLDQILTDGTLNNDLILQPLQRLEKEYKDLKEKVLAKALIDQINNELKDILSRGLIFEIPVPKEALQEVCQGIANLDDNIERAIRLGLLSVSPNGKLLRVPRILPLEIPNNREVLAKQGAAVLYESWWNPQVKIDEMTPQEEEQAQEILRLALVAKEKSMLLEVGNKLTKKLNQDRRFIEVVKICQEILNICESFQIFHNLAYAYEGIGEIELADQYFRKALNKPFPLSQKAEIQLEKADLLRHRATFLSARYTGKLSTTLDLLKQSLAIAEKINDLSRQAWAKLELGRYTIYQSNNFNLEKKQELLQEAEKYLNKSQELFSQIGNLSEKAWILHHLGMLKNSLGDNDNATRLTLESLSINERDGGFLRSASNLHQLGKIYTYQEQFEEAGQCFQKSLKIKEDYGGVGASTAYQWGRLEEMQGHILRALELTLMALDCNQKVRGKDQDKNWEQIRRLFKKWKRLDFANIEEGCDKSAKDLMEQLLQLSDNSRYQYGYGKAIALWGLGKIAAYHEGDIERGLIYLNDSLEILIEKDSEDRCSVQECINRLS